MSLDFEPCNGTEDYYIVVNSIKQGQNQESFINLSFLLVETLYMYRLYTQVCDFLVCWTRGIAKNGDGEAQTTSRIGRDEMMLRLHMRSRAGAFMVEDRNNTFGRARMEGIRRRDSRFKYQRIRGVLQAYPDKVPLNEIIETT